MITKEMVCNFCKNKKFRELDIKVNTNYQTIKNQIKELEFFEKVEVVKHDKNKKNGREYTTVKLI